jgi:transcription initiation factor IIE alpha subunit
MSQLEVQHGNLLKDANAQSHSNQTDQEINKLMDEIENLEKEVQSNNNRLKKVYLVTD